MVAKFFFMAHEKDFTFHAHILGLGGRLYDCKITKLKLHVITCLKYPVNSNIAKPAVLRTDRINLYPH